MEDLVAAAKYFNLLIDSFIKYILGYDQESGGIFGHSSAYYGCIEEQGTGNLHIHMLVWLHGFKSLSQIIDQISYINFQNNLINYLENIIKQDYLGLESDIPGIVDVSAASFKTPVDPTDNDYQNALITDVNCLVKVANMHRHSFSSYKYRKSKECRFNFPRELVPQLIVKDDQIHLKRSHPNINNFNPIVMTSMRFNHDVKFIPSDKDSKALVFYIADYATKSQLSIHYMLLLIAASKKSVDV